MRKDIILSGVGGQGILTIATIIGEAATAEGINLKQAEVHAEGMYSLICVYPTKRFIRI